MFVVYYWKESYYILNSIKNLSSDNRAIPNTLKNEKYTLTLQSMKGATWHSWVWKVLPDTPEYEMFPNLACQCMIMCYSILQSMISLTSQSKIWKVLFKTPNNEQYYLTLQTIKSVTWHSKNYKCCLTLQTRISVTWHSIALLFHSMSLLQPQFLLMHTMLMSTIWHPALS